MAEYPAGYRGRGYKEVRGREGVAKVPEMCVVTVARPPHVQIRRPLLTLRLYLHTFPIVTVVTGWRDHISLVKMFELEKKVCEQM